MLNLLGYARPYWPRLSLGVVAAIGTRFARLVPPIIVATAIDRVVLGSGEPGLLSQAGLVPGGELAGEADHRDRVVEAAKAAAAHEFVSELPEGYDTQIGERGVKLSGGQRQRIAIARALLNDPAIIVFDEATSDVDTETEERIKASLDRLIEDRTAFVIAHRLSTIRDADRVVVMDDGRVVETGTHDELLAASGKYAALWEAQADERAAIDPAESG